MLTMSCEPPVSGRVSAIKSQFENLSSTPVPNNKRYPFQRAATSIELQQKPRKLKCINVLPKSSPTNYGPTSIPQVFSKTPLKATKSTSVESEPSSFSRFTVDPIKRSSVKRSPAFRVGDKQNKPVLLKQSSLETNEFKGTSKTFECFQVKKSASDFGHKQQSMLTDSMRSALRRPLPNGPPPEKPPRLANVQPQTDVQARISYLENSLVFKEVNLRKEVEPSNFLQKAKTELVLHKRTSNLLDCLSCHKSVSNIYDSVSLDEAKPLTPHNANAIKRFSNSVRPLQPEPIYMEPFSHLKARSVGEEPSAVGTVQMKFNSVEDVNKLTSGTVDLAAVSDGSASEDSQSGKVCMCPEKHSNGGNDVHYMCTPIDDSIEDSEGSTTDGTTSLGKSYDEITILVDAAFQKKTKGILKMGNRSSDSDGKSSIRLSRTLTEKRKDYVRRISEMPDSYTSISKYGTLHRSIRAPMLKTYSVDGEENDDDEDDASSESSSEDENSKLQPKTSERIEQFNKLIKDNINLTTTMSNNNTIKVHPKRPTESQQITKPPPEEIVDSVEAVKNAEALAGAVQKEKEAESAQGTKLFQVCLLIGYNMSSNTAYLKSKYPPNEPIPDNIEQFVFPHIDLVRTGKENQEFYLILTDDQGYKIYGYCRRVLPENSDTCLPLCYCIISETKALGFYQKLLKEVESRHGQTETEMNVLFSNLYRSEIPPAGKCLHVKIPLFSRPVAIFSSKVSPKRMSLEVNPKWLTNASSQTSLIDGSATLNDGKRGGPPGSHGQVQQYDYMISHSLIMKDPRYDEVFIRRPSDLRLENTELSELLICLGPELLIDVFSNLLLERKVILQSCNISLLSKAILALHTMLYPFQWQYTIITILPINLIEICQAPFPVLAGILEPLSFEIEDGAVVNLDTKRITQTCGDEKTIIPPSLRKSLQVSLAMVDLIDKGKMLSSVLISEAFLRFFIELFGDYRLSYFHKEQFIQSHTSQNIKFFLEWFVETSMFRHYVNNRYKADVCDVECDTNPEFYNIFDARLMEKSESNLKTIRNMDSIVKNSKLIKKTKSKSFKKRFKEFFE